MNIKYKNLANLVIATDFHYGYSKNRNCPMELLNHIERTEEEKVHFVNLGDLIDKPSLNKTDASGKIEIRNDAEKTYERIKHSPHIDKSSNLSGGHCEREDSSVPFVQDEIISDFFKELDLNFCPSGTARLNVIAENEERRIYMLELGLTGRKTMKIEEKTLLLPENVNSELSKIKTDKEYAVIVMCHYSPEYLNLENQKKLAVLSRTYSIKQWYCGHRHRNEVSLLRLGINDKLQIIQVGCLCDMRDNDRYQKTEEDNEYGKPSFGKICIFEKESNIYLRYTLYSYDVDITYAKMDAQGEVILVGSDDVKMVA